MPRLSKKDKQYWSFFIDPKTHRRKYYELCRRCTKECKQSFRVVSLFCPLYVSKRSKKGKSAISGSLDILDEGFTGKRKKDAFMVKDTQKSAPFCYTKEDDDIWREGKEMCCNGQAEEALLSYSVNI